MSLWHDAAAVTANEAGAEPLHHGGRQTGRQVAKYAAKMVAKNYAKFGDISLNLAPIIKLPKALPANQNTHIYKNRNIK